MNSFQICSQFQLTPLHYGIFDPGSDASYLQSKTAFDRYIGMHFMGHQLPPAEDPGVTSESADLALPLEQPRVIVDSADMKPPLEEMGVSSYSLGQGHPTPTPPANVEVIEAVELALASKHMALVARPPAHAQPKLAPLRHALPQPTHHAMLQPTPHAMLQPTEYVHAQYVHSHHSHALLHHAPHEKGHGELFALSGVPRIPLVPPKKWKADEISARGVSEMDALRDLHRRTCDKLDTERSGNISLNEKCRKYRVDAANLAAVVEQVKVGQCWTISIPVWMESMI